MHKYFFEGEIHTARDYFESRIRAGIKYPYPFRSYSYYLVRLWQWNISDADYNIEVLNEPGHQFFSSYDEALSCFHTLAEELLGRIQEDVKLELVQYHLGTIYPLESKILLPLVLTAEC